MNAPTSLQRRRWSGLEGFRELDLLEPDECSRVSAEVHRLEKLWTRHEGGLPFYTLGAVAYQDIPDKGLAHYLSKARRLNAPLRRHFARLYDGMAAALSRFLGLPVFYSKTLALPGFHIFRAHPTYAPKPHLDLQQLILKWDKPNQYDLAHPISFTLPLVLPRTGAGLRVWDIRFDESFVTPPARIRGRLARDPGRIQPYTRGRLFLHSGMRFHAIAPMWKMDPEEERLTLQGHGILGPRGWLLYW